MTVWLSLALGLVKIIGLIFAKLDSDEKYRVARQLVEDDNLKADLEAVAKAKAIAKDVAAALNTDEKIKAPDQDMRP